MLKTLPLAFTALFCVHLTLAQSFQSQEKEVTGLAQEGKFEEAIAKAEFFLMVSKNRVGFTDTMTAKYYYLAGSIYTKQGNFAAATPKFDSALLILKPLLGECHRETLEALRSAASCRATNDRPDESEKQLLAALAYFDSPNKDCKDDRERLLLQYELANAYLGLGKFGRAAALYEQYIQSFVHKNHEDSILLAKLFRNYGMLRYREGKWSDAMNLLQKSEKIQLTLSGDMAVELAQTYNGMTVLYMTLADWPKAEVYSNKSLPVFEKRLGTKHRDYLTGLNNLAVIHQKKIEYTKAFEVYKIILPLTAEVAGPESSSYATALGNYASCLSETRQYEKIDSILNVCQQITTKTDGFYSLKRLRYLKDLMVLGGLTADFEKASHYYHQAIEIYNKIGLPEHPDVVQFKLEMANIYRSVKEYELSARLHEETFPDLLKNINLIFAGFSDRQRSAYNQKQRVFFEQYANLAEQSYTRIPELTGTFFNYCLLTKGLLFNTSEKIKLAIQESGDPILKVDFEKWLNGREQTAQRIISSIPKNGYSQLDSLENAQMLLEQSLTKRSAAFSELVDHHLPAWTDVRDALKPGEAAIEIYRYRHSTISFTDTIHYAALIVTPDTKDHPVFVLLPEGNNLEGAFYDAYKNTVTDTSFTPPPYAYQQYWAPLEPYLQGIKTIHFAPDGVYHNLSLPTLINSGGKYLFDLYDIRILGSTKALLKKGKQLSIHRTGMVFGNPDFKLAPVAKDERSRINPDSPIFYLRTLSENIKWALEPLPNSQMEVQEIKKILEAQHYRVSLYTGAQATEAQLKSIQSPGILHLATHGVFTGSKTYNPSPEKRATQAQNPYLYSMLFWAGAQYTIDSMTTIPGSEDGILTALEAMNLHLDQTEIVVLSACETGIGNIRNGEGVYGLQRALQTAGAQSVLMSLWKVEDVVTRELMVLFYQKWLKGTPKREALRMAQQKIKEKYQFPVYWGAFVLIGE